MINFFLFFFFFRLRENIKDASMSDLRDFLENIRKYSPKIGEVAMRHVNTTIIFNIYILIFNRF